MKLTTYYPHFLFPFNMVATRLKIKSINDKHLDNRLFYLLLNPLIGQSIPINSTPSDGLMNDLVWKRDYLKMKANAKTLDETIHQLSSRYKHNL